MKFLSPLFAATPLDYGALVLRLGLGGMMMMHGWPKLSGGPERWAKLGGAMSHLGIDFAPVFWGFMGGFGEFVGALLVVLGLFTRVGALLVTSAMFVATMMHFGNGDDLMGASHSVELGIAFFALVIAGGGRFSLDERLSR